MPLGSSRVPFSTAFGTGFTRDAPGCSRFPQLSLADVAGVHGEPGGPEGQRQQQHGGVRAEHSAAQARRVAHLGPHAQQARAHLRAWIVATPLSLQRRGRCNYQRWEKLSLFPAILKNLVAQRRCRCRYSHQRRENLTLLPTIPARPRARACRARRSRVLNPSACDGKTRRRIQIPVLDWFSSVSAHVSGVSQASSLRHARPGRIP